MPAPLPPILRRKLRHYRLVYGSIALAETTGLAALLLALAGPRGAPAALLWLAVRLWHWPTNRHIAAAIQRAHPPFQERFTAAIELAGSTDPVALQGSPALVGQLLMEVDRDAASVKVARLFSLTPLIVVLLAAVIAHLAVPGPREPPGSTNLIARSTPILPSKPPVENPPERSAAELRAQLERLVAALKALPDEQLQALPAHARSLDPAVQAARRAEHAGAAGDTAEAQALEESLADTLSEFARLARPTPQLADLATAADDLAREFAAASSRWARLAPRPTEAASTNRSVTTATAAANAGMSAALPAAPGGEPWRVPVATAEAETLAPFTPPYDRQIERYFEQVAKAKP